MPPAFPPPTTSSGLGTLKLICQVLPSSATLHFKGHCLLLGIHSSDYLLDLGERNLTPSLFTFLRKTLCAKDLAICMWRRTTSWGMEIPLSPFVGFSFPCLQKAMTIGMQSTVLNLRKGVRYSISFWVLVGILQEILGWQGPLAESIGSPVLHCYLPPHYHSLYTDYIGRSCYYGNILFLKTEVVPSLGNVSRTNPHHQGD